MSGNKHRNSEAQRGNRNAAKPDDQKRVSVTIKLPPDLIAELNAIGAKTATIETALREFFEKRK